MHGPSPVWATYGIWLGLLYDLSQPVWYIACTARLSYQVLATNHILVQPRSNPAIGPAHWDYFWLGTQLIMPGQNRNQVTRTDTCNAWQLPVSLPELELA